jgi:formylglycine-generating enzyme
MQSTARSVLVVAFAFACGGWTLGCGGRTGLDFGYDAAVSDGEADHGTVCQANSGALPPSCAAGGPGMTDCGSTHEDCCTSLDVVGGTYYRTYTNDGSGPVGEVDPATISTYRLDKYDVTVGRFRQFVAAWMSGYTPSPGSGKHLELNACRGLVNIADDAGTIYESGWNSSDDELIAPTNINLICGPQPEYATWTSSLGDNETRPINCVNWYEAYAFCIWDGGFLPTEAEWEYAAAGGALQREYPWGATAPGTSNQYAIFGNGAGNCDYPTEGLCTGVVNIAPVGTATLGAGLWGQLDLVGNVAVWALDEFAAGYGDPCIDCALLPLTGPPSERAFRSEYYGTTASNLLVWDRYGDGPTDRGRGLGFRCARTP